MNIQNFVLSAGFGVVMAGMATAVAASPVTLTLTEGTGQNRALVAGSVDLEDAPSGSPGIDLTALNGGAFVDGDVIQLHGRIVGATDQFIFEFSSTVDFDIMFDFDGYDLAAGGSVAGGYSGLIDQSIVLNAAGDGTDVVAPAGGKGVKFSLLDSMGMEVDSELFSTNVTSYTSMDAGIFMDIAAGNYSLVIDGTVGPETNVKALYDLKISAVPLPLPGLLLLGGLGGLAFARRRKAAA